MLQTAWWPQNIPLTNDSMAASGPAVMAVSPAGPVWTALTPLSTGINWMSQAAPTAGIPTLPSGHGYPLWTPGTGINPFWNPSMVPASYPGIRSAMTQPVGQSNATVTQPTQVPPTNGTVTLASIPLVNPMTGATAQEVPFGPNSSTRLVAYPITALVDPSSSPSQAALIGHSRMSSQSHAFHPYRRV